VHNCCNVASPSGKRPLARPGQHRGGETQPLISNGFAQHLTTELAESITTGLRDRVAPWATIRAVGGAVNDVDPQATAFAHRAQNFNVSSVGLGATEPNFHAYWDELRPQLNGLYLSFETDQRPQRLHDAFPDVTLARLRQLKSKYDPDNIFNQNFPIPPAASGEWRGALAGQTRRAA
jgi:hypothetical protein